ncbi:MAG: dTDP-4-dehydrorhamnose 3,5-epimerase [Chloracidobacterium sp.]|nr:dTDP-4-dehydrorhamnose 3,5-epimerase [Chloracidobacterium sp.]
MKIEPRKMAGCWEITLKPIGDNRGYFERTYCKKTFKEHGLTVDWQQENQSFSSIKNTVRGMHFQAPPFSETKLVRVVRGAVLDVFIDLRKDSETFGQWDSIELTEDNHKAIYIPKGFAHGFCSLTSDVLIQYKVDAAYSPELEGGIFWNDPALNIDWGVTDVTISDRDQKMPLFSEFDSPF